MSLREYEAKVRVNGGLSQVTVNARNTAEARSLLETIYGKGSVATTPTPR